MIKLTERLQTIADYIKNEEGIADIGTDHGYLPLYLLEKNHKRKVIFTDVNEGPLTKSRNIIQTRYPDSDLGNYDMRLGDGLVPLKAGEVHAVVIAGMGGILITEIMGYNLDKTRSFSKFILQPRTAADKLRKWLVDNDFYISDENLVYENGRICEIIVVDTQSTRKNTEFTDELDYEFSPILINKKTPIIKEWIEKLIKTDKQIKKSIQSSGGEESRKKLEQIIKRLEKLETIKRKGV